MIHVMGGYFMQRDPEQTRHTFAGARKWDMEREGASVSDSSRLEQGERALASAVAPVTFLSLTPLPERANT